MKKHTNILVLLSAALLTGCASVTTTRQASQMLTLLGTKPSPDTKLERALDDKPYGVHNLAGQVLGISSPKKAQAFSASAVKYSSEDTAPIPAGLERNSVVKKLVENQITGGDITFGAGELKKFASEFYTAMADPYDAQQYAKLSKAQSKSELAFGNILLGYFMAYQKGNFSLRDGTALGKPKISISYTNGTVGGSIDNDTIAGLLTVFAEAVFDYGLGTPVYYQLNPGKQTWQEDYKAIIVTNETTATTITNGYQKIYQKVTGPDEKDFLVGGKTPTAAAFLPTRKLVDAYKDKSPADSADLTVKEFQFIRFSATEAADRSKDLSGLIVRSFGAIHAGQFVYGSFAIGNNDTLAKIVETTLSCLSGRITEYALAKAFGAYTGDNKEVNLILDHYKDIYDQIAKLDKQP
jgi:hypothetical protein